MKPALVVYGNCQAAVLRDSLKFSPEISAKYDTFYYQSFDHPTDGVSAINAEVMARCEILWCQFDETTPFQFEGPVPATMKRITFPSVDFGLLWPFQINDPLFEREDAYPYGMFPYGDRLLMQTAQSGEAGSVGRARLDKLWEGSAFPFDRYLDIELQRLIKREQSTSVRFAAFVISHFRTDRLLWSYNHPTTFMFRLMLNRIVGATFPESSDPDSALHRLGDRIFAEWDPFAESYQAPIFPHVARALDLSWWNEDDTYYFHNGERLTIDTFVEKYLVERIQRQQCPSSEHLAQLAAKICGVSASSGG